MIWLTLIGLILQFVGPIIAEWLRGLFDQAATRLKMHENMTPNAMLPVDIVNMLWDETLKDLSWWQWRKRAIIAVVRKITVARADEFLAAAKNNGAVPVMTSVEAEAVAKAL